MEPSELLTFFEHCRRIRRNDLGTDWSVERVADFAQHLSVGTAGLGDQARIRSDAIGETPACGFAYLAGVGRVDKEFHRERTSRLAALGLSISARASATR